MSFRVLFLPLNLGHTISMANIIKKLPEEMYESYVIFLEGEIELEPDLKSVKCISLEDFEGVGTGAVFSAICPNIVVLFNDISPMCRFFIEEARRKGAFSLLVQEGVKVIEPNFDLANFIRRTVIDIVPRLREVVWGLRSDSLPLMFDSLKTRIMKGYDYGHGECDIIAASGPRFKRILVTQGIPEKCVVVTGQPLYDRIQRDREMEPEGIKPGEFTVGFATQPLVEFGLISEDDYIGGVVSAIRKLLEMAGAWVRIKPHPSERIVDYQEIAGDFGGRALVEESTDMKSHIESVDIFITFHSTAGLEAMLMGIPLICIDLFNLSYAEKIYGDTVPIARSPSELVDNIDRLIKHREFYRAAIEKQEVFLRDELYLLDGLSSKRVADIIEQMLLGRKEK